MRIITRDGSDLVDRWFREQAAVRVEVIAGNIAASLTGVVEQYSSTEILVVRGADRISVSLFCGKYDLIEPAVPSEPNPSWRGMYPIVQIVTDGGASCTLYEVRRNH